MKKTPNEFIKVAVEQFYKKVGKDVYWYWRLAGTKKWSSRLTPYKDLPYIEWVEQQKDKENVE